MKIKLKEIAKRSGYSIATVSRVLSGKAKGRSQSVYDIVQTARDLGYKINSNQYANIDIPIDICLLYTSPSPRDRQKSRMPSSA